MVTLSASHAKSFTVGGLFCFLFEGESSAQILSGNRSVQSIKGTQPVSIRIGDRLHVLSGANVFIGCSARGTPPPEISWRRDGRTVRTGDREGKFEIRAAPEGSRLSIWQFSKEVAGQYECVATNIGGADRVASIITVLGISHFIIPWS